MPLDPSSLSEREREVLGLIARGFSNLEIGAELLIAQPTVKQHVAHIMAKSNLHSRTKLTIEYLVWQQYLRNGGGNGDAS